MILTIEDFELYFSNILIFGDFYHVQGTIFLSTFASVYQAICVMNILSVIISYKFYSGIFNFDRKTCQFDRNK